MRYGATPEAWSHFADVLDLKVDLLPVVSNPNAEISDLSNMKALGKTPSIYNRDRKVIGFAKWTDNWATNGSVGHWAQEPDYGIALQTRRVRAIDIDVPDPDKADAIESAIIKALDGIALPARIRANSGKRLLAFRFDEPMPKRVVPVDGGIVEFLGDGQQFIAAGLHPSGEPYTWDVGDGLPANVPVLTPEELEAVWATLTMLYATGEPTIARSKRDGTHDGDYLGDDPVAAWLNDNWETYDVGPDDQLFIECPFAGGHSTDSGPSSTAYFPAGTGGYAQGHFVCLHASCAGRSDRDYEEACGYAAAQFDDLTGVSDDGGSVQRLHGEGSAQDPGAGTRGSAVVAAGRSASDYTSEAQALSEVRLPADGDHAAAQRPAGRPIYSGPPKPTPMDGARGEPLPRIVRDPKGRIESTARNMVAAIDDGRMIGRWIAYDAFSDDLCWAPRDEDFDTARWTRVTDADVTDMRMELETRGFKPMSAQLLRDSVHRAGMNRKMDSAKVWLNRQRWDGVERIERFAIDCWGWEDNAYGAAVGLYVWTALAGRVLEPGVQADMAPILVGLQGLRKTSAIKAMAPHDDMYTEIRLDAKDDDQSRSLRGKLVGEIEELRGLNSRAIEEIKAFISRRRESWVPKFKEFENHFWRRCLLIGSTNDEEFLSDPTGERRWLPGRSKFINLDLIRETRDQLWAEGAARFMLDGLLWQDAERLAEQQHPRFKISDSWERTIIRWLGEGDGMTGLPEDKGFVTTDEIMGGALGIAIAHQNRGHDVRVQKALKHIGFKRQADGCWKR